MVQYCIVCGCNSDKYIGSERINFFQLPKNQFMRETWLQIIRKNRISHNEKFARVCSLHFSEDSFVVSKRKSKVAEDKRRRRLLQTAVPTLFLTPTEKRANTVNMDFKIIRREFALVCNPDTSKVDGNENEKTSSGIDAMDKSCGNVTPDGTNKTDLIVTTPTDCSKRFFMENCNESSSSDSKPPQMDDLQVDGLLLKRKLRHYRSLHEFHTRSNCTDFEMQTLESRKNLEAEKEALKRKLQETDEQLKKMSVKKEEMLQLINNLQTQLAITTADKTLKNKTKENYTHYFTELLKPYFTEGQILCILEKKKWIQWSTNDYAAAISLWRVSPKAYRHLRKTSHYPLPSLASLRRWALKKFHIEEGFLTDVLTVMRERSKEMSLSEKLIVLSFNEMAVSSEVHFDAKLEKLVGPYGNVQVMMVRSLFSNWKQPIYYKFDQPMNKCTLLESITLCHNAGYQVVAVVSNMNNQRVWKELDISPKNYFFNHPANEKEKVFVFADVPYLLKALRNWFLDDGLLLKNSNELFTREIFQTLVDMSSTDDLCVAHHITQQLLDDRSQRQSVKSAVRIWSHRAAKAIQWAGERGLLKTSEYERFSEFVSAVNKWFDVHNSKSKYGLHPGVNSYGQDLETQESILLLMSAYIENMQVGSRKALMPFQKGILVSNRSLRGLFHYLQKKYPEECQYIITRRIQQDILENFFAYIKGSSKNHSSPYDFIYKIRWYILGKNTQAVFTLNRNTDEYVDSTYISSSTDGITNQGAEEQLTTTPAAKTNNPTSMPIQGMTLHDSKSNESFLQEEEELECTSEERAEDIILTRELFFNIIDLSSEELLEDSNYGDEESTIDTCFDDPHDGFDDELFEIVKNGFKGSSDCLNLFQEAGLEYCIAGFVARKFKAKYPSLETTEDADAISERIQGLSKGYLTNPSIQLLKAANVVEEYFVHFHGDYFSKDSFVIKKVVALVENSEQVNEIPHEVLQYLVKTRTYIRVQEINKGSYVIDDTRKTKKKMKKNHFQH